MGQLNILQHKSWHVWNKDNIARVKKDEAEAVKKEQELQKRAIKAEQEHRLEILRSKTTDNSSTSLISTTKTNTSSSRSSFQNANEIQEDDDRQEQHEHINLFRDAIGRTTNEEYEMDKKLEEEKWARKTTVYLDPKKHISNFHQRKNENQDLNPTNRQKNGDDDHEEDDPWYGKVRSQKWMEERNNEKLKKDLKRKQQDDPFFKISSVYSAFSQVQKGEARDFQELKRKLTLAQNQKDEISDDYHHDDNNDNFYKKSSNKKKMKDEKSKKHKKTSHSSTSHHEKTQQPSKGTDKDLSRGQETTAEKISRLRRERMEREIKERQRANQLLNPNSSILSQQVTRDVSIAFEAHKEDDRYYHSQFNPDLVRRRK